MFVPRKTVEAYLTSVYRKAREPLAHRAGQFLLANGIAKV